MNLLCKNSIFPNIYVRFITYSNYGTNIAIKCRLPNDPYSNYDVFRRTLIYLMSKEDVMT